MRLYETIQKLRKDAGYSQEQLAEKLGVSRQAVSKWENGTASPGMDRLQDICHVFGVSLGELVGADVDDKESDLEQIQLYEDEIKKLKGQKQLQKILILGIAVTAIILLVLFFTLFYRIDLMNNHIQQLDSQVSQIYNNVDYKIAQIDSQFSSMLEEQESLVAEYAIDVKSLNIKDGKLTLNLCSTPKYYKKGMTAEFVINGEKSYSANSVFQNGSFWADIPVDVNENNLKVLVRFTNDGETSTQYLDSNPNIINSFIMEVGAENKLNFFNGKDGLLITGEVVTTYDPRYDNQNSYSTQAKLINYPVSGEVIVEKDGIVVIQKEVELDIDLSDGQYSSCSIYTHFEDRIEDYNKDDKIKVISRIVDNFGNVRETEVYFDSVR